tara:strand:+ start:700 stop:1446 length:747 start_codon:yes stop_codon:yes gene_type:complete
MAYTDDEYEIFSRQFILKAFNEENIKKLENSLITIVGVGGIGCPLSKYLVSSGIKNIRLIDKDKIEKSNLSRQILFTVDDIDKKKVIVAKNKLLKINPHSNIEIIEKFINNSNLQLLLNSSIVIDTCDNWETMKLINEYCVNNYIPLISASVVGFDVQVAFFENIKKYHICLNCLFPNKSEPDIARCDKAGVSGIACGVAGLLAAQKTINYILNLNKENNKLSMFDIIKGENQNINIKSNKNCYLYKS